MKKVFVLKTYSANMYRWSPPPNDKVRKIKAERPYFCDATPGSNGQDWISTYCYDSIVIDNILQKQAYVECGYVE